MTWLWVPLLIAGWLLLAITVIGAVIGAGQARRRG